MQPLQAVPSDPQCPWYKAAPIGVNPVKIMLPKISKLAGLRTWYTNHSLRVTMMFAAGVLNKVIAELTGHKIRRSYISMRIYTSVDQRKTAGFAISGNAPNDRKPRVATEKPKLDMEDKKLIMTPYNRVCQHSRAT